MVELAANSKSNNPLAPVIGLSFLLLLRAF